MSNLTNEQKARLMARYIGHDCQYNKSTILMLSGIACDHVYCETKNEGRKGISSHYFDDGLKLILTPLSQISDEDALESIMLPLRVEKPDQLEVLRLIRSTNAFTVEYRYVHAIDDYNNDDGYSYSAQTVYLDIITWQQCDFLKQRGYDLPVFIEPNHPDNGKTMKELGLAIYESDGTV